MRDEVVRVAGTERVVEGTQDEAARVRGVVAAAGSQTTHACALREVPPRPIDGRTAARHAVGEAGREEEAARWEEAAAWQTGGKGARLTPLADLQGSSPYSVLPSAHAPAG